MGVCAAASRTVQKLPQPVSRDGAVSPSACAGGPAVVRAEVRAWRRALGTVPEPIVQVQVLVRERRPC